MAQFGVSRCSTSQDQCWQSFPRMEDRFFTTTGADAPGGAAPVKTSTGNNFLENAREFPKIITSTGAKFWQRFAFQYWYW